MDGTYSDKQILEAIENMIDALDWNDLRRYIINERMDYYCGNADSEEIGMLIENYGKVDFYQDLKSKRREN